MVETDYVHGQTMSAGLAVTDEQVDRIARYLYSILRDGSWSVESLTSRVTPEWEAIAVAPENDDIEWRIAVRRALVREGFTSKKED